MTRKDRAIDAIACKAGDRRQALPTTCVGDATRLAAQSVNDGAETVIVCGGDGTINEAAQSLVGTETALAVWPCGTANVLAREMRLPCDENALSELIAGRSARTISVGRAVKPGDDWQRYFLLMAGIGLDATIVNGVDLGLKRLIGAGAYLAAGLGYLARMPVTPFSIDLNGRRHEHLHRNLERRQLRRVLHARPRRQNG